MKVRIVRPRFEAEVRVLLPDHVSGPDAEILAEEAALTKIIAMASNPDAPEESACGEYLDPASHNASAKHGGPSRCTSMGGS